MIQTERNRLVVENLPLVGYLVSEVSARATHLSRDDLASAGAVALVTAADAFDATAGVPFSAYARRRIIGAFADEMRAGDWATRSIRRRIKETIEVRETLSAALGRTPTTTEIAQALGVDRDTVRAGLADAGRTVTTLDDTVADTLACGALLPEDTVLVAERLAYLRAAVAALPEKMRLIVQEIYFNDKTVKELAAELGITHSAVSQQRTEAIRLLRDGLNALYADAIDADRAPESRIAAASRDAYLERFAGSMARTIAS